MGKYKGQILNADGSIRQIANAKDMEQEAPYMEDYKVYATFSNGEEECVGSLELPEIKTIHDMPAELEIDGVTYYPQF